MTLPTRLQAPIGALKVTFDHYLDATSAPWFERAQEIPNRPGVFDYPIRACVTDTLVFSTVLISLRETIDPEFAAVYDDRPSVFDDLGCIVTANKATSQYPQNPRHAGFWKQKQVNGVDVADVEPHPWSPSRDQAKTLLRTLRNGFGHFQYRLTSLPCEFRQI
jgi:hypothetical protein